MRSLLLFFQALSPDCLYSTLVSKDFFCHHRIRVSPTAEWRCLWILKESRVLQVGLAYLKYLKTVVKEREKDGLTLDSSPFRNSLPNGFLQTTGSDAGLVSLGQRRVLRNDAELISHQERVSVTVYIVVVIWVLLCLTHLSVEVSCVQCNSPWLENHHHL